MVRKKWYDRKKKINKFVVQHSHFQHVYKITSYKLYIYIKKKKCFFLIRERGRDSLRTFTGIVCASKCMWSWDSSISACPVRTTCRSETLPWCRIASARYSLGAFSHTVLRQYILQVSRMGRCTHPYPVSNLSYFVEGKHLCIGGRLDRTETVKA